MDGTFLITLALGIVLGIFLSASTILFLLRGFPEPLYSFFMGLVLTSVWILGKEFSKKNFGIGRHGLWELFSLPHSLISIFLFLKLAFLYICMRVFCDKCDDSSRPFRGAYSNYLGGI